jgi:uncharacterized protein (DUF2147 family)
VRAGARATLAGAALLSAGHPALAQSAFGVWARDDGLLRSRIGPCGEQICAVNVWAKDPQGPEKVGDRLLMTLKEESAGHWSGSAFDPQRNLAYSMTIIVHGRRMSTSGCMLVGLLCLNAGWRRISP